MGVWGKNPYSFFSKFVFICCCLTTTGGFSATTKLILGGGGELPPEAFQRFVDWGGGNKADILIITWATEKPDKAFRDIYEILSPLQPRKITHAVLASDMKAKQDYFLNEQLTQASAVFFTGGSQNNVMDVLDALPEVFNALHKKYDAGFVFGGTSAGAAIMSERMFTGAEDLTVIDSKALRLRKGLGLLREVLVDQHFLVRQRMNRLLSGVLEHFSVGVGIDENAAMSVEGGKQWEVLGPGIITKIVRSDRPSHFALSVLEANKLYDMSDNFTSR